MAKIKFLTLAALGATVSISLRATNESFPTLSPKELAPKLVNATKTLRSSIALHNKTPESSIDAPGEYYSWLRQCVDHIAVNVDSPLWVPCLNFASQLLRVDNPRQRAAILVEAYQEQRKKWDETLRQMTAADRLFLNQEAINSAKTLSADPDY